MYKWKTLKLRKILIQFLNKTWYKSRNNEHTTCKKNCVILSHLHPQFHHILQSHTYIHTIKLTHWLPRHTTRKLLSTTLRATSEGSMTKWDLPLLTSPGWHGDRRRPITVPTRGERECIAWNRRLAASFGLGDSPNPRLVNHETEQRGPC